jgi:hypothetical protein
VVATRPLVATVGARRHLIAGRVGKPRLKVVGDCKAARIGEEKTAVPIGNGGGPFVSGFLRRGAVEAHAPAASWRV